MTVLSPAAASNNVSDATNLVGIGALMSIGVYNVKNVSIIPEKDGMHLAFNMNI